MRDSTNQTTDPYAAKVRRRDADFRQVGLFGEIRQDLAAEQRLIDGLRADRWRAEDHRSVVRLGMMSQAPNPTADATRRATLASGFLRYERGLHDAPTTYYAGLGHVARFPDYWELVKNESASSVSAFATEPEKTTQLDVGARHRHGAFEFTVSAWWNRVDDFNLVQSNFAKPAVTMGPRPAVITRNIDATTWGAEAGAGWRFAEHWQVDASLAGLRGTNDTDRRPLAQLPPVETRLGIVHAQPTWSIGALVRVVAAQNRVAVNQGNIVGQNIGPSPGFAIFSLNATGQITRNGRVSIGTDNLFDKTYAEHISRAGSMVPGYIQSLRVNEPGRAFWLKLDVDY